MPIILKKGMRMLLNQATRKSLASRESAMQGWGTIGLTSCLGCGRWPNLQHVKMWLAAQEAFLVTYSCQLPWLWATSSKTPLWCNDVLEEKQKWCWNWKCSWTLVHSFHGYSLFTVGPQVLALSMWSSVPSTQTSTCRREQLKAGLSYMA